MAHVHATYIRRGGFYYDVLMVNGERWVGTDPLINAKTALKYAELRKQDYMLLMQEVDHATSK